MSTAAGLSPWKKGAAVLDACKEKVRRLPRLWSPICRVKAFALHTKYEALREQYARLSGPSADADRIGAAQRKSRPLKKVGEVHSLIVFRNTQWQQALLNELRELGPVTVLDFHDDRADEAIEGEKPGWVAVRERKNREILETISRVHPVHPIDWVFCYFDGRFVLRRTLELIRDRFGIPCVKMCLDDKNHWDGPVRGGQHVGQVDLANAVELSWSSSRTTVQWYRAEGGSALYLPEGYDPTEFHPLAVPRDISVSFVGACYGVRPLLVEYLRSHGVPVQVFGGGWGSAGNGYAPSLNEIFNRSQINLGCGFIGHSDRLTNVKGRDFDVPGAGGGVYLTTYNADLAQHYHIGREILCYHGWDECLELVRHYLARPDECRSIARRGFARARGEHRWLHRYIELCRDLGILEPLGASGAVRETGA